MLPNVGCVREFLRHGLLVFAGLIAANALTYVFYAAVTRAVGVESAGLFTSLVSAMLVLALPGTVAATVVAKVVADACAGGRTGIAVGLARRIALLLGPLGGVVAIALLIGGPWIERFFHAGDRIVIDLAAAGFVLTLLLAPQRAVLQGRGDFRGLSASNIVEGVGKAATGFVVFDVGGGLRVALGGYLLAVAASFALNAALTVRGTSTTLPFTRAGLVRNIVRIALPVAAITVMTFVDAVLARHFLPSHEAGLYGSAALAGRAILTVIAFVPTVLLPKAAARVRDGQGALGLLVIALGITGAVIGVMLAAVAAFPTRIVTTVTGSAFAAAGALMLPYATAMAGLAGVVVLATYLIGIGRHGFALPLGGIALAEVVAMFAWHPDAQAFLTVIVTGHSAALLCCGADTVLSVVRPEPRPLRASM